jgi:hypothetical protein
MARSLTAPEGPADISAFQRCGASDRKLLPMAETKLDLITQALVDQFIAAQQLTHLTPAKRFERFVNFCVVSTEQPETFNVEDVSSPGSEVGVDGIAVLVNGALVTSPEQVDQLAAANNFVEATFVFTSAKRSPRFSESEVANIGLAVSDFFTKEKLPKTSFLEAYRDVKRAVYNHSARFSRGLPKLKVYYVTTGRWDNPEVVVQRIEHERDQLHATDLFGSVEVLPVGAAQLRDLYFLTQNPVSAEFTLAQKVTLPAIPGVTQAYLGIMPAKEYVRLVVDKDNRIRKELFTDNVRDFGGLENPVNREIAETLRSPQRDRFPILNNGVTIVARDLKVTGDKLNMRAYQVVNGGQTSHVLLNELASLDDSVWVPIRVIGTDDDDLTTAVVTATNNQTPVAAQELNSRSLFERNLERLFATFDGARALYYERRSRQYSGATDIVKVRIVTREQLVRAFAATFLDEPHRATGYVPTLMEQLNVRLLNQDHMLEPYYAAAFAHYKLEFFWRNQQLEPRHKPGRWQILMAARHLSIGRTVGQLNSKEVAEKAMDLCSTLWNEVEALELFKSAIEVVDQATQGKWERDHMRNLPTTQDVLGRLRAVDAPAQ